MTDRIKLITEIDSDRLMGDDGHCCGGCKRSITAEQVGFYAKPKLGSASLFSILHLAVLLPCSRILGDKKVKMAGDFGKPRKVYQLPTTN